LLPVYGCILIEAWNTIRYKYSKSHFYSLMNKKIKNLNYLEKHWMIYFFSNLNNIINKASIFNNQDFSSSTTSLSSIFYLLCGIDRSKYKKYYCLFNLVIQTYLPIREVLTYVLCRSNHLSQINQLFAIFGGIFFIARIFLASADFALMVKKYKLLLELMAHSSIEFAIFSVFFLLIISIFCWYLP